MGEATASLLLDIVAEVALLAAFIVAVRWLWKEDG